MILLNMEIGKCYKIMQLRNTKGVHIFDKNDNSVETLSIKDIIFITNIMPVYRIEFIKSDLIGWTFRGWIESAVEIK